MSRRSFKQILTGLFLSLLLLLMVMFYHQSTHFNDNVTINQIHVGGMTPSQALDKLQFTTGVTCVYVNQAKVYQGNRQKLGFTKSDQSKVDRVFQQQKTLLPTRAAKNFMIKSSHSSPAQLATMETKLQTYLEQENQHRRKSRDAFVKYEHHEIKIVPEIKGNQFDEQQLMNQLKSQRYNQRIQLHAVYVAPITADNQQVRRDQKKLTQLMKQDVNYRIQNKTYRLTAQQIISSAEVKNGKYNFDTEIGQRKIRELNKQHATLNKSYRFKTHDGKVITTTKKGTFGWEIDPKKATQSLTKAFVQHRSMLSAQSDIKGAGYNKQGTGYGIIANHGIGKTYAEVSLSQQHAWFYRDGKCVLDTDIVSGTDNQGNKTPRGVWYIMYQHTPSILRGKNDDGSAYASKVQYWSPFTETGCGFHDASWRHDWSKTAYLKGGSHGCINMHPAVAGVAFEYLQKNEPVIIY